MLVYIAVNKVNGKRYIGATKHSVDHRKNRHWYDANSTKNYCRVFGAALRKYGKDGFDWSILVECSSKEEMMKEEIRLISEMKPEYNITSGGQGIIGVPRTKQWIDRISASQKGRKFSVERRRKCIENLKKAHAARCQSVVCLNDGRFFDSCRSAAEFYGITHGNIRSVARGGQAVSKGLSFAISDRPFSQQECGDALAKLQERKTENIKRARSSKCRPVVCLNDGKIYRDAIEAAATYGISSGRVRQLYHHGGTTKSGLSFCLDGHNPVHKKELSIEQKEASKALVLAALKRGLLKTSKPVVCLDDGIVYESISAAARSVGRSVESISASIRRNGKCAKKRFKFVERSS